mmetsp:Transcript_14004/g.21194  ORF Transcript_14004/g.21194 Transcript_14004/m.21194 type:complete len:472 (-) Transcript_14004:24-1439(-)
MTTILSKPLTLPCGVTIPNRLCKAAMTEGLADEYNRATDMHVKLYKTWSEGGTGLLITGNVQVDRRYLERPGNVCIDGKQTDEQLLRLKKFAQAATVAGNQCWVQIGHAGRQCDAKVNKIGVGPSAVQSENVGGYKMLIPSWVPEALTKEQIKEIINKFAYAATVCQKTGFTGIQIHSAHGYLLSSFLNPKANLRKDEYGGSLENRVRFLVEVIKATRKAVGPKYPIGVKLNSSDFQKGAFTLEESIEVAKMLDELKMVDLLEISGGNYENPVLISGDTSNKPVGVTSTQVREAFFLKYAKAIRESVKHIPIMVTGGMRSKGVMEKAITDDNISMIGIGRPLVGMPSASKMLLDGKISVMPSYENALDFPVALRWIKNFRLGRIVRHFMIMMWMYRNIIALAMGEDADVDGSKFGIVGSFLYADSWQKDKAKKLKGLNCEGIVLNSKSSMQTYVTIGLSAVGLYLVYRFSA